MKFRLLAWFVLTMISAGCEEEEPQAQDIVVVDAVLVADQAFDGVRLWQLSELSQPLNQPYQADAVVIRSEEDFFLAPSNLEPGNYVDTTGRLQIKPQTNYQLIVVKGEKLVASGVAAPAKPQGLAIEQSVYPFNTSIQNSGGNINIGWSNPERKLFFGRLELTSTSDQLINPQLDIATQQELSIINGSFYQIPFNAVNHYGTYQFILFGVNLEYFEFFGRNQAQLSVQQVTNIANGLGIFTVITSDTLQFQVVPN